MTPDKPVPNLNESMGDPFAAPPKNWLVMAITRLETKVDALITLEKRVQELEAHRSWVKGAFAAAIGAGAILGTAVTTLITYLT